MEATPDVSLVILSSTLLGLAFAWSQTEALPRSRQKSGLPRADPAHLVQHDKFNLLLLPLLGPRCTTTDATSPPPPLLV